MGQQQHCETWRAAACEQTGQSCVRWGEERLNPAKVPWEGAGGRAEPARGRGSRSAHDDSTGVRALRAGRGEAQTCCLMSTEVVNSSR